MLQHVPIAIQECLDVQRLNPPITIDIDNVGVRQDLSLAWLRECQPLKQRYKSRQPNTLIWKSAFSSFPQSIQQILHLLDAILSHELPQLSNEIFQVNEIPFILVFIWLLQLSQKRTVNNQPIPIFWALPRQPSNLIHRQPDIQLQERWSERRKTHHPFLVIKNNSTQPSAFKS